MKEIPHWPFRTYNRGRWDNDLGTLNLIGPDATRRAVEAIDSYETFGLGAPLRVDEAGLQGAAFEHQMEHVGKYDFGRDDEQLQAASDRFSVSVHGMTNSHIDAFSHVGHRGASFNDVPFEQVASMARAERFTIMDMPSLVTRAWFVDVPRARGLAALKPGTPVLPSDLAHLEGRIAPGDALVIRTGRYATRVVAADDPEAEDNHGNWSGLHVDCMPLIARWDVSTVATDSSGDNFPSTTPECSVPIHIITEGYIGLPLIHHLDLEALGRRMADRPNKAFFLSVSPLKIVGGTGSPVNPTAIV